MSGLDGVNVEHATGFGLQNKTCPPTTARLADVQNPNKRAVQRRHGSY